MNIFICHYCGRETTTGSGNVSHEKRCKSNPTPKELSEKQKAFYSNRSAWNKGLTKETDVRVRQNSVAVSKSMKGKSPNFIWTESRRIQQSERKKELYEKFPEKHPNRKLANNRSKMTYPEKVAYDWFVGKKIHFQHNRKVDRYYPDFVVGTNVIIEIDGEYWHDEANDNKRDSVLVSLGYTIYRIKAKENIENRLEEIFNTI